MESLSSISRKIKQSICFRAKYLVKKVVLFPLLVVPHPMNRGGDAVKTLVTKQLIATVVVEGYDPTEANVNAVAVEDKPAVAGGSGTHFQDEFATKVKPDPDMAERGSGMVATAGSLSHSHWNCGMRNVLCCAFGCECHDKKVCECGSKPILDEKGNYSLEKLQAHDEQWSQDCFRGLEWEVLSWKMDVEEPGAALIISIALNKKNEVAMKTGHLEIMSTLCALCKPGPNGTVPFEPVRDKLIDLYGAAVDHPDFVHAFRLVIDAGGAGSVHMQDMENFTSVYVNSKLRKMRMEAYAIVAPYPVAFPKIKNASLKWSWKQTPNKGWCQLPPSISHRLSADSKLGMYDFMMSVELAMVNMSKLASTVVEGKQHLKSKTKWIAEVEINLMSKIFAVPKRVEEGKTVQDQEKELCEQCAAFIATKLLDLLKFGKPGLDRGAVRVFPKESQLMKLVGAHLDDSAFGGSASEKKEGKHNSVVTEPLVPKVISMDADGRPLSSHETVAAQPKNVVETIPWRTWAEKQTKRNPNNTAKLLLLMALDSLHQNWKTPCPIALVRKGTLIQAMATKALRVGELVVPLFVKKPNSVVTEDEGASLHPKAVAAEVSWTETVSAVVDVENQPASGDMDVRLRVQPELKLPTNGAKGLEWTQSDAVHPFWFIQRTDKNEIEANADVFHQEFTHVVACSFKAVTSAVVTVPPETNTFTVSVPFIRNTDRIAAGQEVILKWKPKDKRKADAADTNAFDQILQQDKKQRRAKAKGSGA